VCVVSLKKDIHSICFYMGGQHKPGMLYRLRRLL